MSYPPLKLKKNEERRLRAGHLWVFSNEVNTHETPLTAFTPGEIVTVTSASGNPLGNAYINPQSLICARLYSHDTRQDLDQDLLQARIEQALQLRYKRYTQPFYRAVYSEGDLLPGLVVDRFDNVLVLQTSTLGMDMRQSAIVAALEHALQPEVIIVNNNMGTRTLEGLEQSVNVLKGQPGDSLQVRENQATFTFPAFKGQKTGWFYDHRDNRRAMTRWAQQAKVLDVFSYIGGWGIEAALAGAQHVTAIETSASACDLLATNAEQNGVADKVTIVNADAFDALNRLKQDKKKFDLIVLDPPAFIKRKKDLKQGVAAYQRLNKLAMQVTNNNGILISASCSYHFSRDLHLKTLRDCARQCGHQLQVVEEGHAGADHPRHPAIPETAYLSCFTVRLIHESAP
ncbi:MAG: class I SAM-dependent rRNA methyltransferase [Gammaproteobacteria bacterium]|jgi:23S rRNA (cytosine1962-C5)-methyltransferase